MPKLPHRLGRLRATRMGSKRTRLAGIVLGLGVVFVLVFALVFSTAFGTRKVAAHAEALHSADEALRTATVAHAQAGMAAYLVELQQGSSVDVADAIDRSLGEANIALLDLRSSLDELDAQIGGLDPRLSAARAPFRETVEAITTAVVAADADTAGRLGIQLDETFREITGAVAVERDYQASQVAAANQAMGRFGDLVRILVAFLVPTAVVLLYRELSQRQRRQSELEVRLESEQELGRARDEFVANASHELRTPLTSICGLAHILEEDPQVAASETANEMVGMIISEAHDLSRIVDDLLTAARLDAGALHFQLEDIGMLDEAREAVEPMARAGTEIGVDVRPAVVRADRLRLRQVIRNLLSNAAKYGGSDIRLIGRVSSPWYEIIVADDGEGIPEEMEGRLFQRFLHQGDMPLVLGSVGLGLSIVQALAEGMGGAVWHERDAGWTKFVVRVPLSKTRNQSRFREADLTRKRDRLLSPGGVPEAAPAAASERRAAVPDQPPTPDAAPGRASPGQDAFRAAEQLRPGGTGRRR